MTDEARQFADAVEIIVRYAIRDGAGGVVVTQDDAEAFGKLRAFMASRYDQDGVRSTWDLNSLCSWSSCRSASGVDIGRVHMHYGMKFGDHLSIAKILKRIHWIQEPLLADAKAAP